MDSNSIEFQKVLTSCRTESKISIIRKDQLISYVYVRKVPSSNLLLGFTLMVSGVYFTDCHALNEIFDEAFHDVLLKGELLQFQKDKYKYRISKFADNPNEVKRINQFFEEKLERLMKDKYAHIPTSFQTGNGEYTISLKESVTDINAAVAQNDIVHLLNVEKSISELERIQQMLSALYVEHGNLQVKYRKVLSQKKNFKLVVILSLILLGCITGLWLFNEVLNDKNKEIRGLKGQVTEQEDSISVLTAANQLLNDSVNVLAMDIRTKQDSIYTLQVDISDLRTQNTSLQNEKTYLENRNGELKTDIRLAREELNRQNGTIQELKNTIRNFKKDLDDERSKNMYGERYYMKDETYVYYKHGTNYEKTTWYFPVGGEIRVYRIEDGYAWTNVGCLKRKDIKKL